MPEPTDDRLKQNLEQQGYKQSSSDQNNFWKRDENGNLVERDTDGRYSKERGTSTWKKDE